MNGESGLNIVPNCSCAVEIPVLLFERQSIMQNSEAS